MPRIKIVRTIIKMEPVENWILNNLFLYGNCLVSRRRITTSGGEKCYLKLLKKRGVVCDMHPSTCDNKFYIIELKK